MKNFALFYDWDWTLSWCFFMIWFYHLGTLFISTLHPIGMLQLHDFRVNAQQRTHQLQVYIADVPGTIPQTNIWIPCDKALEQPNVTLLFSPQQFKQNKENYICVRLPTQIFFKKFNYPTYWLWAGCWSQHLYYNENLHNLQLPS